MTNPEVIKSEVKDNAVYLEFSEEMDSPEDYITVYNSTDKEDVSNPLIETLSDGRIKVSTPFLRGIISEYASSIDYVYYVQDQRKKESPSLI